MFGARPYALIAGVLCGLPAVTAAGDEADQGRGGNDGR